MNYQNYLEKIQIVNQSNLGASVLILLDLEGILCNWNCRQKILYIRRK